MPEWSVPRRFPRYTVHLLCLYEVAARAGCGCEAGWTLELSEGGACLGLGEQLQPQTSLRLRLQTDRGTIEVDARVIWAGRPDLPGGILHGVAFTQIAPDHLQALRDLLRAPGSDRRDEVRLPLHLPVTCHRWTEPLELWTRGEPIAHGLQLTSRGWSIPLGLVLSLENPAEVLHPLPSSEEELPPR